LAFVEGFFHSKMQVSFNSKSLTSGTNSFPPNLEILWTQH